MIKMSKVLAFLAITALVTSGLSAQEAWMGPESNTAKATAGVFGNEIDDFMSVTSFGDVEIGKWMGYMGADTQEGGTVNMPDSRLSFGYSQNLGASRLGIAYMGNIASFQATEWKTLSTQWMTDLRRKNNSAQTEYFNAYNNAPGENWDNPEGDFAYFNNNAAVLLGFGSVGIKLGVNQNMLTTSGGTADANIAPPALPYDSTTTTTYPDGTVQITNARTAESNNGYIKPFIQAGFALDLGGVSIAPYIGASYGFYKGNWKGSNVRTQQTFYNGNLLGGYEEARWGGVYDSNVLDIGAGVDIGLNESMGFSIAYGLYMPMYNNSYSDSGYSGSVKGSAMWDWVSDANKLEYENDLVRKSTNADVYITEIEEIGHRIIPGFSYTKELSETFKFGAALEVPIWFYSRKETPKNVVYSREEVSYIDTVDQHLNYISVSEDTTYSDIEEFSNMSISPEIALGASFAMFPGRFTVNAGFRFSPFEFARFTQKTKNPALDSYTVKTREENGASIIETSSGVSNTRESSTFYLSEWEGFVSKISGGFTFNFTEVMALDFQADAFAQPKDNNFNMSLNQVNVIFSLKF